MSLIQLDSIDCLSELGTDPTLNCIRVSRDVRPQHSAALHDLWQDNDSILDGASLENLELVTNSCQVGFGYLTSPLGEDTKVRLQLCSGYHKLAEILDRLMTVCTRTVSIFHIKIESVLLGSTDVG